MAAEAFAALGIAANVAQFTEYALALVSDCRDIYDSAKGTTQENLEIEAVIRSVKDRHDRVKLSSSSINTQHLPRSEINILRHVKSCEPIAKALISILEGLKEKKLKAFPRLDALRIALASASKAKDIRALKERLLIIENEISREILFVLNDNQSSLMGMIRQLQQTYEMREIRVDSQLDDMKQGLREFVSRMSMNNLETLSGAFTVLHTKIDVMKDEAMTVEWEQQLLESLSFEELGERESSIKNAGEKTLEWIFTDQSTNFTRWLISGQGIYWVGGKAGSGKSTLMKYVSWHPDTTRDLESWAGSAQLVVARHFFWNSGLPLQKTQRGLLQSLLYQIFSDSPSVMREVCPKHVPTQWKIEELNEIIDKIKSRDSLAAKYCFFIDGLDEYEGDHEDIVEAIMRLSSSSNIKVCTSSRPWIPFARVFDIEGSKLVLQDHTKKDMIQHARQILSQDDRFKKLASATDILGKFPEKVADKAQGVWLWTFLVVRNILRDLPGHEDYHSLLLKLENIPAELNDYDERMLSKLNAVDRREADTIFLIAVDALAPLPLLALTWLSELAMKPDSAIYSEIRPVTESEVDFVFRNWQILLSNRCRDLLEIRHYASSTTPTTPTTPILQYRVDFLHRTVRDFLYDWYQHSGRRQSAVNFNSYQILCGIMLKLLKSLDVAHRQQVDLVLSLADEFLYYASKLDLRDEIDVDLIDELDRINCDYFNGHPNHWTNARPFRPTNEFFREFGQISFLALAIQAQLHPYVSIKLENDPYLLTAKAGRPLLDYALRPIRAVVNTEATLEGDPEEPEVNSEMIRTLLRHGADPNETVYTYPDIGGDPHTVWSLFLYNCLVQKNRAPPGVVQSWHRAAVQLITSGAHVNAMLRVPDISVYNNSYTETMRLRRHLSTSRALTPAEVFAIVFSKSKAQSLIHALVGAHRKRCKQSWQYWLWWGSSLNRWEQKQLKVLSSGAGDDGE